LHRKSNYDLIFHPRCVRQDFTGQFLSVDGVKPTFSISPNYGDLDASKVSLSNCQDLLVPGSTVMMCSSAELAVMPTASNFDESGNLLSVVNADVNNKGCSFQLSQDILVIGEKLM